MKTTQYQQHKVGFMYYRGDSVEKNHVLAYVWLNLAVDHGYEKPKVTRRRVANLMDDSQLQRAKKLSCVYYEKYVKPFQQQSTSNTKPLFQYGDRINSPLTAVT